MTSERPKHENVHVALAAAQAQMKHPEKNAKNAAFKKPDGSPTMYADLACVVDAARDALTANGLSFWHEMREFMGEPAMATHLVHGASNTSIVCPIPLRVDRQNMHGLKSAITYAKRIGLESVTGLAPADDDDGNAAAKYAPKPGQERASTITADQFTALRDKIEEAGADEGKFAKYLGVDRLHTLPADRFDAAMAALANKIKGNANGSARDA